MVVSLHLNRPVWRLSTPCQRGHLLVLLPTSFGARGRFPTTGGEQVRRGAREGLGCKPRKGAGQGLTPNPVWKEVLRHGKGHSLASCCEE